MKKRLSVLSFLIALVFAVLLFSTNSLSNNALAVENSKNYEDGEIIASSDTLYEPNANITDTNNKDNTIIPSVLVYYTNFSSVQESRYYEEYTSGYWYKGTLNLKSVVVSGNGWNATYSGTLTARVE